MIAIKTLLFWWVVSPLYYGIPIALLIYLFHNPQFLQWYKQPPWLNTFLMTLAATLVRLMIIPLIGYASAGTMLFYFLPYSLPDALIAMLITNANWFYEKNPLGEIILFCAPVNFIFWGTVFSIITWIIRPKKPKVRPVRLIPADRWAGRG